MVNPCFRLSLQTGVRYIAMADLAICILCATLRYAVLYHQEEPYDETNSNITDSPNNNKTATFKQTEVEYISFNPNTTNTWNKKPDGTPITSTWIAVITTQSPDELLSTLTTATPNETNSTNQGRHKLKDLMTTDPMFAVFVLIALVGFIIYICYILLEVWMCRLLLGASSKRDSFECKRWFWIRSTITVFSCIISMVGMATFKNDWVDWVIDSVTIYRIYELFVVNEFRKEILATGGVVRFGV